MVRARDLRVRVYSIKLFFFMACDYPYFLIRDTPVVHILPVPCGSCAACRKDNITMWQDRIAFESLTSRRPSTFLTLTYDDAHRPPDGVRLSHVQKFNKRFRYYLEQSRPHYNDDPKERVRYFCASEYGDQTLRPHYHMCITNLDCFDKTDFTCIQNAWRDKMDCEIGIFTADGLLPARIRYCVEYISFETPQLLKAYETLGLNKLFHCMSKGIGSDWIKEHADDIKTHNGYFSNGVLRPIPYYYKKVLGMVEKNAYLRDLNDIWSRYNDILRSKHLPEVDPFDIKTAVKNGYLNASEPFSKRKRLSAIVGNDGKERHLCAQQAMRLERRKARYV